DGPRTERFDARDAAPWVRCDDRAEEERNAEAHPGRFVEPGRLHGHLRIRVEQGLGELSLAQDERDITGIATAALEPFTLEPRNEEPDLGQGRPAAHPNLYIKEIRVSSETQALLELAPIGHLSQEDDVAGLVARERQRSGGGV